MMNKPSLNSMKEINNRKITRLIARKKILEAAITESVLLDEQEKYVKI